MFSCNSDFAAEPVSGIYESEANGHEGRCLCSDGYYNPVIEFPFGG